jgi:hypothetical protein
VTLLSRPCSIARRAGVAVVVTALSASTLSAQLIGTEPSRSPFRDLPTTQQLTLSVGWLSATKDAAGVGPEAGPLLALRHDIHLGGPAWLTSRYQALRSERRVIDPGLPAVDRFQGMQSVTHHIADIGITVALTGKKTWRGVVPTLGGGLGITSDFASRDVGGYLFGTKFAFSFGPGVRIVLPRGYSMRVDLTNNMYQFQYPSTYFIAASDTTRVLEDTRQRSSWRSNWGITTGISIPLFR